MIDYKCSLTEVQKWCSHTRVGEMAENMSTLFDSPESVLLNLVLQFTCLALAVVLLAKCIPNNAAVRCAVLSTGLISLLLLSLTSVFLQSSEASLVHFELDSLSSFDWRRIPAPYLSVFQIQELNSLDVTSGTGQTAVLGGGWFLSNTVSFLVKSFQLLLMPIILLVWASGVLLHVLGIRRSLLNIQRLIRRSRCLKSYEEDIVTDCLQGALILPEGLAVRISAGITTPFLAGVLKPVILLPENFLAGLSRSQLRAIMRHELAHYYRRDPLANLVQKTIVAIFWIHPLIHRIDRMLAQAREEVCDNYVLTNESAVEYGETLLQLCAPNKVDASASALAVNSSGLKLGVVGGAWNIEERISGLLNQNREITMRLNTRSKILLNVTVLGSSLALSACQVVSQTDASSGVEPVRQAAQVSNEDGRDVIYEYSDKTVGTLGPAFMRRISEVQELMEPADGGERDLEAAKGLLDALAERRLERMNDFEKSTLYNFYTNYYLAKEDYQGATNAFEDILQVSTLRSDIRLRSLRSLGQLHAALENWSTSIGYYEQWRSATNRDDDTVVLQGLSYAHYQLENYNDALVEWEDYMTLKRESGEELTRENYSYLNGLHYSLENWEQALKITEEMIRLFNTQADRDNLDAINSKLEEASAAVDAG